MISFYLFVLVLRFPSIFYFNLSVVMNRLLNVSRLPVNCVRCSSQITKAPKAGITVKDPEFDKVTHTGQVSFTA